MTGPQEPVMALGHPCYSSSSLAFPGLFPEGSWSSGNPPSTCPPPTRRPLQPLAVGFVLQAQTSQLHVKE